MITNNTTGTNLNEIAPGIYRINTPIQIPGGPDFNFNQYLVADDEPLLFHTGPRRMFPLVVEAIARVLPSRGCATSPSRTSRRTNAARSTTSSPPRGRPVPVCSQVAAMVSVNDVADRPARALADGEACDRPPRPQVDRRPSRTPGRTAS